MRLTVSEGRKAEALRTYLPGALPGVPAWAIRRVLADRQVKRGGQRLGAEDLVGGGEELTVYLPASVLSRVGDAPAIPVVYEDARVCVVNKPWGIASRQADDPKGEPGVLERLLSGDGQRGGLRLCHRLDHNTGGLLLLAKDDAAEAVLRDVFQRREVEKVYTCLVVGTPEPTEATLRAYLRKDARDARVTVRGQPFPGAAPIETAYRVVTPGDIARLEVRLITGRTHQIRGHLAFTGHPVLGDDKYGDRAVNRLHGARRQMLWATRLSVRTGGALPALDGRVFAVEAPF